MTAAEEIAKRASEQGREKGREEGRTQGQRELLVKLLTLRFGPPDEQTLKLLGGATTEQLTDCGERVLSATSLAEVLAPCR